VGKIASLIALIFSAACLGEGVKPLDDHNAADNAMMTWFDVGSPVGHMLLIRRGADRCVIRFTTFHRGHDAKPETAFNSGAESFFAEYEWYHANQGAGYETGHRAVSSQALTGIGRLAFQPGDDEVHCGPFKLVWFYPVRVGFNDRNSVKDIGIELAPTKWTAIEQVNFNDPALRWYTVDESRKPTLIPIERLP
jgi:hypothetical protein